MFDFDYHEKGAENTDFANVTEEWHDEVDALRLICESNGIAPLVERSRSGRGAHVWILFKNQYRLRWQEVLDFCYWIKAQHPLI